MLSFQDLEVFFRSQLTLGRRERESACSMPTTRISFGLLPRGYCERNTSKP